MLDLAVVMATHQLSNRSRVCVFRSHCYTIWMVCTCLLQHMKLSVFRCSLAADGLSCVVVVASICCDSVAHWHHEADCSVWGLQQSAIHWSPNPHFPHSQLSLFVVWVICWYSCETLTVKVRAGGVSSHRGCESDRKHTTLHGNNLLSAHGRPFWQLLQEIPNMGLML